MSDLHQKILGRRCRPITARRSAVEYYYEVVAVWFDESAAMLMCGLLSDGGGANVLPFIELDFEPSALRGPRVVSGPA